VGPEFQVNAYTTNGQSYPVVAAEAAGNVMVVWQSVGSAGSDGSSSRIQGQCYDADGMPQGSQFQVNTYPTNAQRSPALASDAAGNVLVTWESVGGTGADTSGSSIQARRYDGDGVPQGVQFQVNSYTTSDQYSSAVTADAAGNFIVTWASDGSGSDPSG